MFPDANNNNNNNTSDKQRKPWQTIGAASQTPKNGNGTSQVRVRPDTAYRDLDQVENVKLNFQAAQQHFNSEITYLQLQSDIEDEKNDLPILPVYSEKSDSYIQSYNNSTRNHEHNNRKLHCERCKYLESMAYKSKLELDSAKSEILDKERRIQELQFILANRSKIIHAEPRSGSDRFRRPSLPSVLLDFDPAWSSQKRDRRMSKKCLLPPVATVTSSVETRADDSLKSDSERMEDVLKFMLRVEKLVHDPVLVGVLRKCECIIAETGVKMPLEMLDPCSDTDSSDFEIITSPDVAPAIASTFHVRVSPASGNNKTKKQDANKTNGAVNRLKNFFRNKQEGQKYKKLATQSTGDLTRNHSSNCLELENMTNYSDKSTMAFPCEGSDPRFVSCRGSRPVAAVETRCRSSIPDVSNMVLWKTCEFCNQVYEESHVEESRLHLMESHCIVCHQSVTPSDRENHIRSHDFIEDLSCSPLP